MSFFKELFQTTIQFLIVIIFIFFSTSHAKNFEKYDKADYISDYISGVLLFNQEKYEDSSKYLKKLDGLEKNHNAFTSRYLYSLVNSGEFNQAYNYSKKIEKKKKDTFESNIIIGIKYLKNSRLDLAKNYFLKAEQKKSELVFNNFIIRYLNIWSNLNYLDLNRATQSIEELGSRFNNLNRIQKAFLHCYYNSPILDKTFNDLLSDEKVDFSRYNYFYANYLFKSGNSKKAKNIINNSIEQFPRNLLLNQYKIDIQNSKKISSFDCRNEKHVIAEILYIAANGLAAQSVYTLSTFYLNLAKYLNSEFKAFDILLAENFYNLKDFVSAKKIYKNLSNVGTAYNWHSMKQISRILTLEKKEKEALKLLKSAYENLPYKGIYETFDYGEFLKNNKKFEKSIKFYTKVIESINSQHPLYPKATDSRGVAYERIGEWNKAEKDLLSSLKARPEQAYVINYLAYSWIEKGIKIEKSLKMLEKANKIKSNDPYIIDSLGWALFKLERYKESKDYIQLALRLMPADPIVNDHFGDVLWKNGNKIQARYYWNYVLGLDATEKDLRKKIQIKLIEGL